MKTKSGSAAKFSFLCLIASSTCFISQPPFFVLAAPADRSATSGTFDCGDHRRSLIQARKKREIAHRENYFWISCKDCLRFNAPGSSQVSRQLSALDSETPLKDLLQKIFWSHSIVVMNWRAPQYLVWSVNFCNRS